MPKLAICSDSHGFHRQAIIPDCDILIHCGDFTTCLRGQDPIRSLIDFNSWLGELHCSQIYVLPGNHDELVERDLNHAKSLLTNAIVLCDTEFEIADMRAYSTPWMKPFMNWAYMTKDPIRKKQFDLIPSDTEILITHTPPFSVLDFGYGDPLLSKRIQRLHKLKYHFFGHVHSEYNTSVMNDIMFVNASLCDEDYCLVNKPIVIDI